MRKDEALASGIRGDTRLDWWAHHLDVSVDDPHVLVFTDANGMTGTKKFHADPDCHHVGSKLSHYAYAAGDGETHGQRVHLLREMLEAHHHHRRPCSDCTLPAERLAEIACQMGITTPDRLSTFVVGRDAVRKLKGCDMCGQHENSLDWMPEQFEIGTLCYGCAQFEEDAMEEHAP